HPAMALAMLNNQFCRDSHVLQPGNHEFSLLNRHQGVGIAMNDPDRRIVIRREICRRDLFSNLSALRIVGDRQETLGYSVEFLEGERSFVVSQGSDAQCTLPV